MRKPLCSLPTEAEKKAINEAWRAWFTLSVEEQRRYLKKLEAQVLSQTEV